jgi:hypothetical protein
VLVAPAIAVAEDEIEMDAVDAKPAKKPAKKPKPKKAKPADDAKPGAAKKPKRDAKPPDGDADAVSDDAVGANRVKPAKGRDRDVDLRVKPTRDDEPAPGIEPAPAIEPAVAASASVTVSASLKPEPETKRFYVRGGVALIAPLTQSRELELADVDGAASLAIDNGPVAGSGAAVSSATVFAATLGYRLTRRLGLEAVLGVPFTVKLTATVLGKIGTILGHAAINISRMQLGVPERGEGLALGIWNLDSPLTERAMQALQAEGAIVEARAVS